MLWKLLGLQKKLDALFDDGWVSVGFAASRNGQSLAPAVSPSAQAHE